MVFDQAIAPKSIIQMIRMRCRVFFAAGFVRVPAGKSSSDRGHNQRCEYYQEFFKIINVENPLHIERPENDNCADRVIEKEK